MKLKDVVPNWATSGAIFSAISELPGYTPPWSGVTPSNLDLQYIGNHSGGLEVSPLVDNLLDATGVLPQTSLAALAAVIVDMYGKNWERLWATMTAQYAPLENYSMTESEQRDKDNSGTVTDSGSITHGQTLSRNGSGGTTGERGVYGFNSPSAVNQSEDSGTSTVTETQSSGGTDTTGNQRTDALNESETKTLTRSGNIGVTTSQQMLSAERNVWLWSYFGTLFGDVDRIMTSPIF